MVSDYYWFPNQSIFRRGHGLNLKSSNLNLSKITADCFLLQRSPLLSLLWPTAAVPLLALPSWQVIFPPLMVTIFFKSFSYFFGNCFHVCYCHWNICVARPTPHGHHFLQITSIFLQGLFPYLVLSLKYLCCQSWTERYFPQKLISYFHQNPSLIFFPTAILWDFILRLNLN